MDLWIVLVLYATGLTLVLAETVIPGVTMGVIGVVLLFVSTIFGFKHHWVIGAGQIGVALVATPLCFWIAVRRLSLKATIQGNSFAQNYDGFLGKEGLAQTTLRPAGIALIEGKKMDVVTAGESVEKGSRVKVTKVEGNRIVVRSV
ncbi:MAG TPA: NfeD family protein [Planctomycetota bacterium]|nr:NfeD family protein [Planctomycetota bacterium]